MKVRYKQTLFKSLWHISFKKALILSLPLLLSMGLVISGALSSYNLFLKTVAGKSLISCLFNRPANIPRLNSTILHLYLHDQMQYIFNHLTTKMPTDDGVCVYSISIDPIYFKALNSNLPASGRETSYPATLMNKDGVYPCRARYRGGGHWHWNRTQKSWRINLSRKQMVNRAMRINLINPKTILGFNEITSMYLAKQASLLAPLCLPVKFVQNREYMGFYNYWEQVDEYFIRRNKRIPGTIYDGDGGGVDKETGAPTLWRDQRYWTQVYTAFTDDADNRKDITELINVLDDPCLGRFYDFSKRHLDIENYCSYASFDSIVGCFHHTFNNNNKLAFDPITGRFLAIPWDIHIWTPPGVPNHKYDLSANALLYKWKLVPLLEYKRQKRLWELINGSLSKEKILARLEEDYKVAYPIIKSDKYRDGSFAGLFEMLQIPQIAVRPFSMKTFNNAYEKYKGTIITRNEFLRKYLSDSTAEFVLTETGNLSQLIIQASGTVGVRLQKIVFDTDAEMLKIYRDTNRDGILDENDDFIGQFRPSDSNSYELDEVIFPGFKLVEHNLPRNQYGTCSLVPSNLLYSFFIDGGHIRGIEFICQNPVTGEPVTITRADDIDYDKAADTASLHPWNIPKSSVSEDIVIGPGVVDINESITYPEYATVTILPGTELYLSEGASLIFRGKVLAEGTEEKPIITNASDVNRPWGTFALQGKGASGSKFEYCLWSNGSKSKVDLVHYPAMFCIHDANDVAVKDCVFTNNEAGSAGMRVGYSNVAVEGCLFTDLKDSALKADSSKVEITSCGFRRCNGKAIDSVMSSIVADKCSFKNITAEALLAREDSSVRTNDSVFIDTGVSVEAQDASDVEFINTSFHRSLVAISTTKGIYSEGPKITSNEIFVNSCNRVISEDAVSQVNIKKVTNTAFVNDFAQVEQGRKLQELIDFRVYK